MSAGTPNGDLVISRYVLHELDDATRARLLNRAQTDVRALLPRVQAIIDDVRSRGDRALIEYTREFDGVDLDALSLTVSDNEFEQAERMVDAGLRAAITDAVANIRTHHSSQVPETIWTSDTVPGVLTGERFTPLAAVGLYVPRGKGSFPSVMMMLSVPAKLAGVPTVVVCTPPGPDGSVDAASLVTARLCGVSSVLKVGGAQAIAALAYGTESVPSVLKIVGPGNQWVSAAKRLVYGDVDPGPPAGPSESVVLCDEAADPEVAAYEWLVEAEHGPDSAALLVTPSVALADKATAVASRLVAQLPQPRRDFCQAVLGHYGGIVLTRDLAEAFAFVNAYAPEHLRLLVAQPMESLGLVANAGEVLLGEYSSIPFANFCAGVNAILPTGGNARTYSCVGVADFLKRSSFVQVSATGAARLGATAVRLAEYEGFPAHASAARFAVQRARGNHE